MRSLVAAILITGVALIAPSPASAQSVARPGSWTITPFLNTSGGIGDPAPDGVLRFHHDAPSRQHGIELK